MQPDPTNLFRKIDMAFPPIGLYDAPDPAPFEPLVEPVPGRQACLFAFWKKILEGNTLHLTADNYGCGGAARAFFGIRTRPMDDFIKFLADDEGLKSSRDLMRKWVESAPGYSPLHGHILYGHLREDQWDYLKTVTFYVNPDQLSTLMTGAQYNSAPTDPPPVIAPFSSGCGLLLTLPDLNIVQAAIGATDIAMRHYLPPDILAFTVTKPMFAQLCGLDERSFLYKPFLRNLRKSRGLPDMD